MLPRGVMAFTNYEQYPFWVSMAGSVFYTRDDHIYRESSRLISLQYITEGKGYVAEAGKSVVTVKGDAWLLHAHREHNYYTDPDKPWKKIWINVGGPVAEKMVEAYGLNEFHYPQTNIQPYLEEFHQTLVNIENQKVAFDKCAGIFMRILQHLYDAQYESEHPHTTIAEAMKKYIDNHSEIDVSFNDLIEQMHCSKSYAIRSFKKKYNITPYNYVQLRKIELAKTLLKSTDISVNEISDYLGMCDCHYFSKFFKKNTGMSPTEYRNYNNK